MLTDALQRISAEYEAAKAAPLKKHPLAQHVREIAAEEVKAALGDANPDLITEGSVGRGNWAAVPWVAIFDPLVTGSATSGYYPVYLFHASEPIIHLSLNQGTTETREEFGPETRKVLRDRAAFVRKRLADFSDLIPVEEIDLGSQARLPGDYAAGHALGFTYDAARLPAEAELQIDLHTIVGAYRALTFRGGLDLSAYGGEANDVDYISTTLLERRQYRLHRRIERNPSAARLAKKHHGTRCQACGLDFSERYGVIGDGFAEAHHLRPISSLTEGAALMYDVTADFAVLCANCHRMIHRTDDPSDLQSFRDLVDRYHPSEGN